MISKVLVLGYYDRQNLGDDMFKFIFGKYFEQQWSNCKMLIKNTDDIEQIDPDTDLVICGGGDIINDYFMEKIKTLTAPIIDRIPIYALGIGFPYISQVNNHVLNTFDYIAYRTQIDTEAITEFYGSNRAQYYPDLGWLLPRWSKDKIDDVVFNELTMIQEHKNEKKIGIFLTNTIKNANDLASYNKIMDSLASSIVKLADQTMSTNKLARCVGKAGGKVYQIYLISMSTNTQNPNEDDRKINIDLYTRVLKYGRFSNLHLINTAMPPDEILPIFRQFYVTICTRFHAHIFSMIAKVPFLSIYSSRKVEDLLTTYDLHEHSIKMEINQELMYPISLDSAKTLEKFTNLVYKYDDFKIKLDRIYNQNIVKIDRLFNTMNNLIWTPVKNVVIDSAAFQYKVDIKIHEIATKIVRVLFPSQTRETVDKYITQMILTDDTRIRVSDLVKISILATDPVDSNTTDNTVKINVVVDLLVELIVFNITGDRVSEYNYGLREQIMSCDYNFAESIKWIMVEQLKEGRSDELLPSVIENPIPTSYRKFDMRYFKQHALDGHHRSGWKYVVNALNKFHGPGQPIFDSFLDKTFGWNYDFYESTGMLPFKKPWAGIFHHTHNENFTMYNLVEVFKKPLFLMCLTTCIGLYVLSRYSQAWLVNQLNQVGFGHIKVTVLYHPTEFPALCFTWNKFNKNYLKGEAQVVQVGTWYRNSYAIFRLPTPLKLKKAALKGKEMDNAYLTDKQYDKVTDVLYDLSNMWSRCHSNNSIENCGCHWNSIDNGGCHGHHHDHCDYCSNNNHSSSHNSSSHNSSHNSDSDDSSNSHHSANSSLSDNSRLGNSEHDGRHDHNKKKCRCHRKRNKYMMGLIDMVRENHESVRMIPTLNDAEYDKLLSENVVFINLVDASAVNTVIECIVRRTPLVVNRLPAVEEYLGKDYPLFYNTLEEAEALLNDINKLKEGYEYLLGYDTTWLHINTFLRDFIASLPK